jgi:hypothetical protein
MLVVVVDPRLECTGSGEGTRPLLQPEAFLFQRAHHALGVGMALGVVIARKGLLDSQGPTGPHEGPRGGLTAVVTHQRKPLVLGAFRELVLHGHIQGREPMLRCAPDPSIVADDRLGTTNRAPRRCRPNQRLPPAPWSYRCPTMRSA